MNPKISLIIPVYNVERYLKKCLDSVVNQTLKDIEIIIVDDGSTDDSLHVCRKYETEDSRIKVFSQKNRGQGYARNLAIKYASGVFIFCLDADDWIELDTLEKIYDRSVNDNADVVICGWKRIDEKSGDIIATRKDTHLLPSCEKDIVLKYAVSARLNLMACSCLIKKSIFDNNYIVYPNIYHEDLYVMLKVYFHADRVSILKEDLYYWLVRSNSTTNTFTMDHAIGLGGVIHDWKNFLLKEHAFHIYKNEYVQGMLTYLNMYLVRTNTFASYEDKKKILEYLKDLLGGTHELKEYKTILSFEELQKRQAILKFYERHLENNISNGKSSNTKQKTYFSIKQKAILKSHKIVNNLLPIGSKRREYVKSVRKSLISIQKRQKNRQYDVVFMPHKDYQVWTMALIAKELKKLGLTSCLMDLTDYYKDERSREASKKFPDIPFLDFSWLLNNNLEYKTIVCMNDWDKKVTKPQMIRSKAEGKKTIGIIEGINDFYDKDVHWERNAYQTVKYLLMTGEHDRQFFQDKQENSFVTGVPRLKELLDEEVIFPQNDLAVINVNFSYGVLEDKREMWIESVIDGCKMAGIDYIITKHPADKGDYSQYKVSTKNMYDTIRDGSIIISRFGSIILESLAMGKPAIYHNPHNEQVLKFQDPMGAYSLSYNSMDLSKMIKYELDLKVDYRVRANEFLDYHCNIKSDKEPSLLAAETIYNITEELI